MAQDTQEHTTPHPTPPWTRALTHSLHPISTASIYFELTQGGGAYNKVAVRAAGFHTAAAVAAAVVAAVEVGDEGTSPR